MTLAIPDRKDFHPPRLFEAYKSTLSRAPSKPLIKIKRTMNELSGPIFNSNDIGELDHDLTRNSVVDASPIGERIIVHGKVVDSNLKPIANTMVEIWQANSAGRYVHKKDRHNAPLDPNFLGAGRCLTDDRGGYIFYTIKPGAYPWGNHSNAWRPNHIHFSLFGPNITTRLVTQMYFPGDPLLHYDPIFNAVPLKARKLLISNFDLEKTAPDFALAYRFDIILRGSQSTPFEE